MDLREQFRWMVVCAECCWRSAKSDGMFCAKCGPRFWAKALDGGPHEVFIGPGRGVAAMTWARDGVRGAEIARVIHSLKGGRSSRPLMSAAHSLRGPLTKWIGKKIPVWIPAPARQRGQHDHALAWAKALQALWGGHIWNCLSRSKEMTAQKTLRRDERRQIRLEMHGRRDLAERILAPSAHHALLFCDDVITTGATWLSAGKALDLAPGQLKAVALAYRALKALEEP